MQGVQKSSPLRQDNNWIEVKYTTSNPLPGMYKLFEFFLNNTNLTFLAFLYKIDIEGFQNEQK